MESPVLPRQTSESEIKTKKKRVYQLSPEQKVRKAAMNQLWRENNRERYNAIMRPINQRYLEKEGVREKRRLYLREYYQRKKAEKEAALLADEI